MRTALRTYHPVPSLQKTDGNLQDAPRIKNILKSCLLPSEVQNTPATPAEVLSRSVRCIAMDVAKEHLRILDFSEGA